MKEKVLYIITKGNWGGAQKYVFAMAVASQKAGFEPVVAIGGDQNSLLNKRLAEVSIRTVVLPSIENTASIRSLRVAERALRDLFKKERPSIVHLNSSLVGIAGALAARSVNVPRIIFTAHGWAFNEERPRLQRLIIFFLHYLTVFLSHTTICVSDAIRRDVAHMPFIRRKLVVIRHGIVAPDFKTKEAARNALLPGKQNAFWFGMLGELHPTKGVFEAVEAFGQIATDLPDALLVIMGEGHARSELERFIETCGVEGRVILLGHVVEGSTYLPAYDIFLFPSRTEALGYAAIEAGFAGLPVVGTNVGGIPEVIQNGTTGILVPRKDVGALAEAMQILSKDAVLRRRLGEALKTSVTTRFSEGPALQATLATYRS